ncbi:MAG: ABC transporter ATP-binding protein [Candidatus Bathyarchaeia archaeon]
MKILEGIKVTKLFGGFIALHNVDFCVYKGEIVGLIGPNGAGKTTLFNIITGAIPATSGIIKFEGKNITGLRPHEICKLGIARTFQIPKPFPRMNVYENLLAAATFGRSKDNKSSDLKQEINQIMEKFGLKSKSRTLASNLAMFEQRMLEIARALIIKPKLLLLDEVLAGLNPKETMQAVKIIRELREEGTTIFMIEHNMRAIMELSDRIIVLHQGMKIAEGKPEEVSKNIRVIEAYLGEAYVRS